jgi:hypothetical protein
MIRRHWQQSHFTSLQQKQTFAIKEVSKLLTLCLHVEAKTDVEIRFSFDGADHHFHISYIILPKRRDPFFSRVGEEVTVIDCFGEEEIKKSFQSAIDSLQYLLDNRVR